MKTLCIAVLFAIAVGASSRAQDGSGSAAEAKPAEAGSGSSAEAPAETPAPPARPHKIVRRGVMAMKPVVCRAIDEAKGKSGAELADAIEQKVLEFHRANYRLSGLMHADPPVACFHSNTDPTSLPRGAR
jgi:hypothetical protein